MLSQFLLYSIVTQSFIYRRYIYIYVYIYVFRSGKLSSMNSFFPSISCFFFFECIYTHSFISSLSSFMVYPKRLDVVPCVIQDRISLLIHPKCNRLHLPAPNSSSFSLPPPPPWQPQVCFLYPSVCFVDSIICAVYQIPHISDIIGYFSLSVWLTSLSMRIFFCVCTFMYFYFFKYF